MRFVVEEAVTGTILSRDLEVINPELTCNLSGAAQLKFELPYMAESSRGIDFKAYGQIIHVEETIGGVREIIASCITDACTIDPKTGNLTVPSQGFSAYAKGLPWLDNYNPIAVDPFEVVQRIWNKIQAYPNGNIGVTITPASSGTLLLPGFSFDGIEFNIDFFAFFVRASDFRDSGDEMNKLARDIPFDYLETSVWDAGHTVVSKSIVMSYPRRGAQRTDLSFRLGENVLTAEPVPEAEIEWVSDVIIRGWFPGKIYSSTLTNADPKRFRRVIKEEDAKINSNERAQVWANRKLTRRQVPHYWGSITIDMDHSNAQFGTWELGDDIFVQGIMPWVGKVEEWHKIIAYKIDSQSRQIQLTLKHAGAFNYDPIEFEG